MRVLSQETTESHNRLALQAPRSPTVSSTPGGMRPASPPVLSTPSRGCADECMAGTPGERKTEAAPSGAVPSVVREVLESPGEALDPRLSESSEAHFGADFSRIRVHTDGKAAASASSVNARAYTVGNHIVFGSGEYMPASFATLPLLAHELVHALQDGQIAPSSGLALQIGRADSPFEAQAASAQSQIISSPRCTAGPVAPLSTTGTVPLLHRQPATSAPPAPAATPSATTPAQGGYTGAEFANAVGEQAVASGQFTWTNSIRRALFDRLDELGLGEGAPDLAAAVSGPDPASAVKGKPDPAFAEIADYVRTAAKKVGDKQFFEGLRRVLHEKMKKLSAGSLYGKGILSLVGPDSAASEQSGKSIFDELWKANAAAHGRTEQWIPGDIATLNHLRGVFLYEKEHCGTVATEMGKKFNATMPATPTRSRRRETMMPQTALTAQPPLVTKKASDKGAEKTEFQQGHPVRGDEVQYRQDLPAIVDKMKTALADGWILHVRVLGGGYLDVPAAGTPLEEHSLLIIGYSGDEFFAVDPDVSSNEAAPRAQAAGAPAKLTRDKRPPLAFQSLYFDRQRNRLTTAQSDADFSVHVHTDAEGMQRQIQSQKTHRYQAIRVFTVR